MKPANAPDLLAQTDIDGGLIGGASLGAGSVGGLGVGGAAGEIRGLGRTGPTHGGGGAGERGTAGAAGLVDLGTRCPRSRPASAAFEAWAGSARPEPTRDAIDEGLGRLDADERDSLVSGFAAAYPDVWRGVVADLGPKNAEELLGGFPLILDGTDNFETRFLLNDAAVHFGVPWLYAAVDESQKADGPFAQSLVVPTAGTSSSIGGSGCDGLLLPGGLPTRRGTRGGAGSYSNFRAHQRERELAWPLLVCKKKE